MRYRNPLTAYETSLVDAWETTHKQGLLTLWIFLALNESAKSLVDIQTYLQKATGGTISADDKSLYRSLRRYYATEMVDFTTRPSQHGGPPVKLYSLSASGQRVLQQFIIRNLPVLIHNQQIKEILST